MNIITKFLLAISFILGGLTQPIACMGRQQPNFMEAMMREAIQMQEQAHQEYLRRERERNERIQRAVRTQAQYPEGDPRRAR